MTSVPTRATGTKHVLVICQLDAYANGVKPVEIQRFLRQLGHDVRLVDTYHLSRSSRAPGRFAGRLPAPSPRKAALYATEATAAVLTRRWRFGRSHLSYYLLLADHRLRRAILKRTLPLDDYDLVICETIYDAGVLAEARSARTLYDAPAPWADEVYFDGRVTDRQHRKLRRLETAIFEGVDHLALHWDSYARYAVEHYRISGHNLMSLNFGCVPAPRRADFATPPRVVYLGNVTAGFNNPALLSRLSRLYPRIDVYGGPPPDPALGLNYLGYAPSIDVLRTYQLGLVTCSEDQLRRDGFSSKHVHYLSYGLPVLVPSWRRHLDLLRGSVVYTEETFRSVVEDLSDEGRWRRASDEAYAQAERLSWDETLRPLEHLLSGDPPLPRDRTWT
ncbi:MULTISPECIES: glycosyltransferase family protein [Streptomyces]|uniref:Glycosyltransferase n=1 Tax=Streptomyces pseudovenezuelae TaxID=67350 RepID=A0A117PRK8_9ACTN|nr:MULTISPECIES: hypothetical protein [Streptomyces]KUM87833.1 hypothetical protein AQI94_14985 [Streptomyces pseudovenezuelae]